MKKVLLLLVSLFLTIGLYAGDAAQFVNLGFSADGEYFMFGEYVYDMESSSVESQIYIVDVDTNRFVSGGVIEFKENAILMPGQTAAGAFYKNLEQSQQLRRRYSIDHVISGRPVYIRIKTSGEDELDEGDELSFRDFATNRQFEMKLINTLNSSESEGSSFYIQLTVSNSYGLESNYEIGLPNYVREGVEDYTISKVIVGPNDHSLIVVIEKRYSNDDIKYMVETLKIN